MDIVNEIGLPAMLGQLAEECCELGQAALKYQRILMGTNPTPVTEEDAVVAITEEATDVLLCLEMLRNSSKHIATHNPFLACEKLNRWRDRIKAAKEADNADQQ